MTAHLVDAAEADGELVGRCYTKARRAPLVHGVIRDVNGGRGIRLPGGPYTLTQLAAIVGTFVVLILTRDLWGGHGVLDAVLLLGLPFGAAFALRHLHIDGRNPAAALVSVLTMLTGPGRGRLHGRPYRPARPTRWGARITLTDACGTGRPDSAGAEARPPATGPAATRPAAPAPVPGGADVPVPVPSGVQALLAQCTPSTSLED